MATQRIDANSEVEELAESGNLGWGALVRDGAGLAWLAFDTEDGPRAVRPFNEEDPAERRTPVVADLEDLPLPLYVTTEERN